MEEITINHNLDSQPLPPLLLDASRPLPPLVLDAHHRYSGKIPPHILQMVYKQPPTKDKK